MQDNIIFLLGLIFLLYFSYKDLRYSEVDNKIILIFFLVGMIVFFTSKNHVIKLFLFLFWVILTSLMWKLKIIGGADVKILSILPFFYLTIVPNIISGQIIFLLIFSLIGTTYGVVAKIIIKRKKEIPFIPIITLTYIINYIFWIM